jgi:hypothetical protein
MKPVSFLSLNALLLIAIRRYGEMLRRLRTEGSNPNPNKKPKSTSTTSTLPPPPLPTFDKEKPSGMTRNDPPYTNKVP